MEEDRAKLPAPLGKRWRPVGFLTIKKAEVQALHARIGREKGIYAANRVLALFGRCSTRPTTSATAAAIPRPA